ncbi:MAG: hypothetical protein Q8O90_12415 [Elusimicrobiota bacterium]|nr:hypothetical protein [Elusimicrobiota bacterium]
MEEIKSLIAVIKTGAPAEIKAAQKRVEKLWRQSCTNPELKKAFVVFALKADELIRKHRTPELKKYKCISSLPPGIFKSCHQLLNQSLLTTDDLKAQLLVFIREQQAPAALPPHKPGHA